MENLKTRMFRILDFCNRAGDITIGDLQDIFFGFSRSSAIHSLSGLTERGYLEKLYDHKHPARYLITVKGFKFVARNS